MSSVPVRIPIGRNVALSQDTLAMKKLYVELGLEDMTRPSRNILFYQGKSDAENGRLGSCVGRDCLNYKNTISDAKVKNS